MNILITGSSGFIGRNLVEGLSDSHAIIGLDRKIAKFNKAVKQYAGNTEERDSFDQIKEKADAVLHFGSASSIVAFKNNPGDLFSSEIRSFFNALEYAIKSDAKIFIYPSSASIYRTDKLSGDRIVEPPNVYGLLKITEESICRLYSHKVRTVGLALSPLVSSPGP